MHVGGYCNKEVKAKYRAHMERWGVRLKLNRREGGGMPKRRWGGKPKRKKKKKENREKEHSVQSVSTHLPGLAA
jgi:hypothetical protein